MFQKLCFLVLTASCLVATYSYTISSLSYCNDQTLWKETSWILPLQCNALYKEKLVDSQLFFFLNGSNVDFPDAQKSTFIFEMCYKNQVFCKRDSNAIDTFKKMVYLLPSL